MAVFPNQHVGGNRISQGLDELFVPPRFGNETKRACPEEHLLFYSGGVMAGQHDPEGIRGELPRPAQKFDAVHGGHGPLRDNNPYPFGITYYFQTFLPRRRRNQLKALTVKQLRQSQKQLLIIINKEYFFQLSR